MTLFVAAFGMLATIAAFALYGRGVAGSTGLGALVALCNFLILRFIVVRVVEGDMHRKLPFFAALFAKMGALMVFVYYVIAHHWVEPIPFVAGLSALVVGLLVSSVSLAAQVDNAAR
ncbi:MAG TPA: ATP synthase subunit I [Polyangiales bacterium]|nr:ATP synthase subunit I [Polyangiales bacterium]